MPVCGSCATENPAIARFCLACGAALRRACATCNTENPAAAQFCMGCGSPLDSAPPAPAQPEKLAPHEERRPITAVFVDIVGSTSRAEQLDPEDVLALLEPYYVRLRRVLERHGGVVEKFIGDAVVALFGAPIAHEDDPERAVRAGLAILTSIAELNAEDPTRRLEVRIGVTTGEAIVSLDARVDEGRGMAWGDVLNTAARLQSAAPVNGLLVDERTYRASATRIDFREVPPVTAKGKAEPVPVWEAVGLLDVDRSTVHGSQLVGRTAEIEELERVWEGVVATGTPALATLVGEPGLGKTRLLSEFTARATGAIVHWGGCLSYGEGITYWPVTQIIKAAAGILASDGSEVSSAKLDALIDGLPTTDIDQLRTIASALSNLVGAPTTPRGTYNTTEISQAELHWGIRRLCELLAADQPLVLVFEDLHWAEPTLVELLESLVTIEAPLLVLASARPELADTHPRLLEPAEQRTVISLGALSAEDSGALIAGLAERLVGSGLDRAALERLVQNAGGNPLFLEETVQMVLDAGPLDAAGLESLRTPHSLQALVAARLDGLPAFERHLAQHASVAGITFWSSAAARLDDRTEPPNDLLDSLERRTIVSEHGTSEVAGEREWEFKHMVIRDVAYGRLPKGRRVGLHVRFADWISEIPERGEEFVEILAYHLEQSCILGREVGRTDVPPPVERAVDALAKAAEKAERREGVREANRFYTRALELVGETDEEQRLTLRLPRAATLIALGELNKSTEELVDIVARARTAQRSEIVCEALTRLGNVDMKQGRAGDARAHLEEAARLASELGDDRLRIHAAFELSAFKGDFEGTIDAALEDLEEGIGLATANDDVALRTEGHLRVGMLLLNVGRLTEADEHLTLSASLAGGTGSLKDDARATSMLALVKRYRGDRAESERLALQAHEWLERTADSYFQIQNLRLLALLALESGDSLAEAEQHVAEALSLAREGGGWLLYETYRLHVDVLVSGGRIEEARTLVTSVVGSFPDEDPYVRAAVRLMEAAVASAAKEREAALDAYQDAIGLLDEQQLQLDLGEAQIAYARALRGLGEDELARSELAVARETFTAMGAQGLVDAIDRV